MSYILEALKRSERERGRGAVSPLTTDLRVPDAAGPAGRARRPWALGALAALAGVLVLAGAWWLTSGRRALEPARVAGPVTRNPPAPVPAPAGPAHAPAAPAVALAQQPAPVPRAPAASTSAPEPATPVAPSPAPAPALSAPATAAAPPPPARPGAAPTRAPIPRLDDLSAAFRAQLPKFDIEVYVYSPQPALRWVLIDMHKYREGQALPGGGTLDRITADGLVVDFAGRRFLVPRPG